MDWTSIIIAVIALIGTFSGSALGIRQSNKVMDVRLSGLEKNLEGLEKKVDKHNDLIERVAKAEQDIKSHGCRLDDLEEVLPRKVIAITKEAR